MEELFEILKYKREYGSVEEELCITLHLDVLPGMTADEFGNRILKIGDKPTVLFSSHTDTVHRTQGMQKIMKDENKQIIYKDDDECLGADDGAGMWLMIQMIKEKIPGLYIFHRGEECGGLGSSYIAHDTPEILEGITKAVAFDRRGTKDIINRQSGGMCCSEEFVTSLSDALDMGHSKATGSFTDTANYTSLIEECTNVSCGYYEEHRKTESLDYEYLGQLLLRLCQVNWEGLEVARTKGDRGYAPVKPWNSGAYSGLEYQVPINDTDDSVSYNDIVSFVMNHPQIAADILYDDGITLTQLARYQIEAQGWTDT